MKNSPTQSPDEKPINSKSESNGFEGEIKIDHSVNNDKAENLAENILDKSIQSSVPVSKPTAKPAHERHIEPINKIEIDEYSTPELPKASQDPVVVPGGVSEVPQNPNNFFMSQYRGRKSINQSFQASSVQPSIPVQNNPVYGGVMGTPTTSELNSSEQGKDRRVRLFIIVAVVLMILTLILLTVFMYNRANTNPQSIYNDGISRTSKALLSPNRVSAPLDQLRIIDSSGEDKSSVSSEDIVRISQEISEPLAEYMFTTDEDTAIFFDELYINHEDVGSKIINRYSISINQANFDKFCESVSTLLVDDAKIQELSNASSGSPEAITKINEFCSTLGTSAANNYDTEISIDTKTKIIESIKFTDKSDQNSYIEFARVDS